ncbi:hypothetical protein GCM10007923_28570 [Shinella yambaruensis]|uniref:Uncharacterized protein n=1 Tax=Shinella yambaruensis TaxID=415996 RepID=A0ABQ5ZLB3_9HYPH|nr:hypothetical protein GCM10007923_28570 [Shinella yambaruensis]
MAWLRRLGDEVFSAPTWLLSNRQTVAGAAFGRAAASRLDFARALKPSWQHDHDAIHRPVLETVVSSRRTLAPRLGRVAPRPWGNGGFVSARKPLRKSATFPPIFDFPRARRAAKTRAVRFP